jgi:hypothetical protein
MKKPQDAPLQLFFFSFKYSELGGYDAPRESPCLAQGFAGLGLDSYFCPQSICRGRELGGHIFN